MVDIGFNGVIDAGDLLGSGLDALGLGSSSKHSAQMAEDARKWEYEKIRHGTNWYMQSLQQAGINPILAGKFPTPGGAPMGATPAYPISKISTSADIQRTKEETSSITKSIEKMDAEIENTHASTAKSIQETNNLKIDGRIRLIDERIRLLDETLTGMEIPGAERKAQMQKEILEIIKSFQQIKSPSFEAGQKIRNFHEEFNREFQKGGEQHIEMWKTFREWLIRKFKNG